MVESLPAVVWVPWGRKGVGRYFKVPYLRWFLRYFVEYHIGRSLRALDRRFHATTALSGDPDSTRRTARPWNTTFSRCLRRLFEF